MNCRRIISSSRQKVRCRRVVVIDEPKKSRLLEAQRQTEPDEAGLVGRPKEGKCQGGTVHLAA